MVNNANSPDLALTTLTVLQNWGITHDEQINLLGLPADTRARSLNKYRNGITLPENDECLMRVNYILAIQNAASSLFPHNSRAADYWVTTRVDYFDNYRPLDIMLNEGVDGMRRVLNYLNGTADWS